MTQTEINTRKRWLKRAAVAGLVLGMLCPFVPPRYQTACHAIASLCTGALP